MSDTILGGAGQQQQQQGQQQQQQQGGGDGGGNAFDFRELIGQDGKFTQGWTDKLPESHKPFAGSLSRFPGFLELAGSYANAEKKLSTRVQAPNETSTPEQIAEWRKLIGAPEKPEDYGLAKPDKLPDGVEWNDAAVGKLAQVAHKHHLPPSAVKELLGLHLELSGEQVGKSKLDVEAYVQTQTKALQDEWKGDFNANLEQAVKAAGLLGVDVNDPDFGSNAKMIKLLHSASKLMREDKLLGGDGSRQTATEQIAEIRASDAYQGKQGQAAQEAAAQRIKALSGAK